MTVTINTSIALREGTNVKLPWLRHCASILNFHGRRAVVIEDKGGYHVVQAQANFISDSKAVRCILTALRVVAWATVVLPLLAALGAHIFNSANGFINENNPILKPSSATVIPITGNDTARIAQLEAALAANTIENKKIIDAAKEASETDEKALISAKDQLREQTSKAEIALGVSEAFAADLLKEQDKVKELQKLLDNLLLQAEKSKEENLLERTRAENEINQLRTQIALLENSAKTTTVAATALSIDLIYSSLPGSPNVPMIVDTSLEMEDFEELGSTEGTDALLEQFLNKHHIPVRLVDAKDLVAKGREVLRPLIDSKFDPEITANYLNELNNLSVEDRKKNIVVFMWYQMFKAIRVGEAFSEGSFNLQDDDGKLYDFLSKIDGMYWRTCSHLNDFPNDRTRGFNVDGIEKTMPGHFKHILMKPFTRNGKSRLLIKPEHWGTQADTLLGTATHFLGHSWEYCTGLGRRTFGNVHQDGWRKERIPEKKRQEFMRVAKGLPGYDDALKEIGKDGQGSGIGGMYNYCEVQLQKLDPSDTEPYKSLKQFVDQLKKEYRIEVLPVQIGNEHVADLTLTDLSGANKDISFRG